jgi:nucleoside-diphosphate-sugar epimerase
MGARGSILVTGALGQIGSELTEELRRRYGAERVVAADIRSDIPTAIDDGPFTICDVADRTQVDRVLSEYRVGTVFHMAAILSATGEGKPQLAWKVNADGLVNVLEAAREHKVDRVLCPSSIAVYGADAPRDRTPQSVALHPSTMYGVTKVAGELLCAYYRSRFGLDARGLRYPGIISHQTLPGGGTTDYAVEIFYEAIRHGRYTCWVRSDTTLPMMYMRDCIRGTIELMEAPPERLSVDGAYNVAAISFAAGELAAEIAKHIPSFECAFEPDSKRQGYADSWPRSIDDSAARRDWGWRHEFDLAAMTRDMLEKLRLRLAPADKGANHVQQGA